MAKRENYLSFGWFLVMSVGLGVLLMFLLTFAFHFGTLSVFGDVTLTALIQAEATIIGFFGIVFVYALTSYENRRDKIESTQLEFTVLEIQLKAEGKIDGKDKEVFQTLLRTSTPLLENIKKNRKELIDYSLISGFCLILSLLSFILALAAPNVQLIILFSSVAVGLLFIGIFQIFWAMHELGKDPCEQVAS